MSSFKTRYALSLSLLVRQVRAAGLWRVLLLVFYMALIGLFAAVLAHFGNDLPAVALAFSEFFFVHSVLIPHLPNVRAFGLNRADFLRTAALAGVILAVILLVFNIAALTPVQLAEFSAVFVLAAVLSTWANSYSRRQRFTARSASLHFVQGWWMAGAAVAATALALAISDFGTWYYLAGWALPPVVVAYAGFPLWKSQTVAAWQAFGLPRREFSLRLAWVTGLGFVACALFTAAYAWGGRPHVGVYFLMSFSVFAFVFSLVAAFTKPTLLALMVFAFMWFTFFLEVEPNEKAWGSILFSLVMLAFAGYVMFVRPLAGRTLYRFAGRLQ